MGEGADFFGKPRFTDDQTSLGIDEILTGVVGHVDVPFEVHHGFVFVHGAHVKRPPRQSAGEIGDLKRYRPFDLGANQPASNVFEARRIDQLLDIDFVCMFQRRQ